jgi:hypothetical protein
MHTSFSAIGVLVFLNLKVWSKWEMVTYTAILANVKMIGGVLLLTSPVHLYLPYLMSQQADAGIVMLAPHPFILALLGGYVFAHYFWK